MSIQPDTDRRLAKTSGRLAASGGKLLGLAAVLAIVGAVLILTGASTVAGLFCIALALPPALAGTGLVGSGAVGRRASKQKPFA
jgi:hypothetical protein